VLLKQGMHILGIDPGSHITGYASIEVMKSDPRSVTDFRARHLGVFQAPRDMSFLTRLGYMHQKLYELAERIQPQHCVIEDAYVRDHPRSALKLGQAKGALVAAALRVSSHIHDMTAPHAKKTITGKGAASKKEVADFLQIFLRFTNHQSHNHKDHDSKETKHVYSEDASDALALALAWGLESHILTQTRTTKAAHLPNHSQKPQQKRDSSLMLPRFKKVKRYR